MKILSLIMFVFGLVSLISVLRYSPLREQEQEQEDDREYLQYEDVSPSEPLDSKDSLESDPLFEELQCSYCHKEIKKGDPSTTNALGMRYHRKCWDEFSDDE